MTCFATFSSLRGTGIWWSLGCAVLLTSGNALAADPPAKEKEASSPSTGTNAPAATPAVIDFSSIARLISDRNIFDPDRQPRTPGASPRRVAPKPRQVDAPEFGLVGIMDFPRGTFAFFDGNAAEYKKAVGPSGTVAGYTVTRIGGNTVTLLDPKQKPLEMRIGTRLRRDGDAGWQVSAGSTNAFVTRGGSDDAATATGDAGGDAAANEILKRLLKKREQEMK